MLLQEVSPANANGSTAVAGSKPSTGDTALSSGSIDAAAMREQTLERIGRGESVSTQPTEQRQPEPQRTQPTRQDQEQFAAVQKQLNALAAQRGELQGARDGDPKAIEAIKVQERQLLDQHKDLLSKHPEMRTALERSSEREADKARAARVLQDVQKMAEDVGLAQARAERGKNVHVPKAELERYLKENRDLLEKSPEFRKAVEDLQAKAIEDGRKRYQEADRAAAKISEAIGTVTDDEQAIIDALKGKTPAEVEAIRQAYQDRYGRDLDADVIDACDDVFDSNAQLDQVKHLLKGERLEAEASRLQDALDNWFSPDAEVVHEILESPERDQILEKFNEQYAEQHGLDPSKDAKENFREVIKSKLQGLDQEIALALLDDKKELAEALKLHKAINDGKNEELIALLEKHQDSPETLAAIRAAYNERFKESLDTTIENVMFRHPNARGEVQDAAVTNEQKYLKAQAIALAKGDKQEAAVLGIREALEHDIFSSPDEEKIQHIIENADVATRERIKRELGPRLQEELDKDGYLIVRDLLETGKLTDVDKLRLAMKDAGTKEEEIKAILDGKSKEEIETLCQQYKEKFGRDLKADLKDELSGDDWFDVQEMLRGNPTTLEERYAAMERRYRHDRSGATGFVDLFSKEGEIMDADFKRSQAYMEKVRNGTATAAERSALEGMLGLNKNNAEAYRAAKNAIADTAADVGTAIAATAVVVGTGGTGIGLVVAFAAAATTRATIKATIKGDGYGQEELATDVGYAALEVATAKVGLLASKVAARLIPKSGIAQVAVEGLVDGAGGGALGGAAETALNEGVWKDGLGRAMERIAVGAGVGAAAGAVGGVAGNIVSDLGSHAVKSVVGHAKSVDVPLAVDLPHAKAGESIKVGRSGDVVVSNPNVSREHIEVRRTADGSYFVRDGNGVKPSTGGTSLVQRDGSLSKVPAGEWRRVEPGQVIDLAGVERVRIPPQNIEISPGKPIEVGRSSVAGVVVPADSRSVSGKHASIWGSADGKVYIKDGSLDGKASTNGTFIKFPDGREVRVGQHAVELQEGCLVSLGGDYLIDPRNVRPRPVALADQGLATMPAGIDRDYQPRFEPVRGEGGRTFLAGELRLQDGYVRGVDGAPDRYLGRDVIGRGTPIDGGVYIGVSRREAIVVDFNNATLEASYNEFISRMDKLSRGSPAVFKERVLRELNDFVDRKMGGRGVGIVEKVDQFLEKHNLSGDKKVHLGVFLENESGVCRHRALMAAAFLERMAKEGRLSGAVEVQRNGISEMGAHAWAFYKNSSGDGIVLDPMQGFVGRADDANAYWDYRVAGSANVDRGGRTVALKVGKLTENDAKVAKFLQELDKRDPSIRVHSTADGRMFVDWGNINGLSGDQALLARARHQIEAALTDMHQNGGILRGVRHNSEMAEGINFVRLNNGRGNSRVIMATDPQGVSHVIGAYTHGDGLGNDYDMFHRIIEKALQNDAFRWSFGLPKRA